MLFFKDDFSSASKALKRLRGDRYNIDAELLQIKLRVRDDNTEQLSYSDFLRPWAYKPILIGAVIMFFQQFSGMDAALFYSVDILQKASSDLDALIAGVIVAFTAVLRSFHFIYRHMFLHLILICNSLQVIFWESFSSLDSVGDHY